MAALQLTLTLLFSLFALSRGQEELNDRPIIGILSQELTEKMIQNYGYHKSFIASSYVQFVHGGGARAVPLLIGENQTYYQELLQYVNGVLLPGGSVWFDNTTGGYVEAGRWILEEAEKINKNGTYFPVWGTCLGFELITYLDNDERNLRINCSASNIASTVKFTEEASISRLFKDSPDEIMKTMESKNVTTNFHRFCITPEDFSNSKLANDWKSLSTSVDVDGIEYVSIIEHRTRPYYGVQYHPEKPLYEWGHFNIPHDKDTVRVSQYTAAFLVNEARKNNHSFPNEDLERQYLIYKYPATFGNPTSTYTQLYFFD